MGAIKESISRYCCQEIAILVDYCTTVKTRGSLLSKKYICMAVDVFHGHFDLVVVL
jgi:hypothetical protein